MKLGEGLLEVSGLLGVNGAVIGGFLVSFKIAEEDAIEGPVDIEDFAAGLP